MSKRISQITCNLWVLSSRQTLLKRMRRFTNKSWSIWWMILRSTSELSYQVSYIQLDHRDEKSRLLTWVPLNLAALYNNKRRSVWLLLQASTHKSGHQYSDHLLTWSSENAVVRRSENQALARNESHDPRRRLEALLTTEARALPSRNSELACLSNSTSWMLKCSRSISEGSHHPRTCQDWTYQLTWVVVNVLGREVDQDLVVRREGQEVSWTLAERRVCRHFISEVSMSSRYQRVRARISCESLISRT